MRKILYMVLLAYVSSFAGDLFVETLDEQQSSKNLLVLRFRINNGIGPIQNAVLKYCLQKDSRKTIVAENYYVEDARVTLLEVDSTNACVEIAMAYIPEGVFPNQSGYSIGIHYEDWSNRDKTHDYSNPQSTNFSKAENVALYIESGLVYGSEPAAAESAHYDAKFTAFRPENVNGALAFVDVKNTGNRSISKDSLFIEDSQSHKVRILKKALDINEKVRVYFDSLSNKITFGETGELLMMYGSTSLDYLAWGKSGKLATAAQEASLWDDASDYVKDFGENAYNFVPSGDGLFYGRTDLNAGNSFAWMVYSEYGEDSYEEHLPDASPYVLPNGIGIVIKKNEPMRFVWNRVPYAEQYRLFVLDAKDSSLVYQNTYTANIADVELPEGDYLWSVQSSNAKRQFKPLLPEPYLDHSLLPLNIAGKDTLGKKISKMIKQTLIRIRYELEKSQYDEYVRLGAPFDTIVSSDGRKDTKLLNISWGEFADVREWDAIHQPLDPVTRPYDEDEGHRCWAIAIQELNHHYTTREGKHGNLTLDEIIANVKIHADSVNLMTGNLNPLGSRKGPALAAFRLQRDEGGSEWESLYGLKYALNIPEPTLIYTEEKYVQQGNWNTVEIGQDWIQILQSGKPIYVTQCNELCSNNQAGRHALIVDGYRINYAKALWEFHFINIDNYGHNEWRVFLDANQWKVIHWYITFDVPTDVALTDPDVHNDDDHDGVMNFDEKYRFDSDYNNPDTDDDGIDDKTEIHSYTIRERARLVGTVFNPLKTDTEMSQIYPFIHGVDKETLADVDGDGLRAENDPDSDGDGKNDGDEDLNHNGYVDRDYCIGENHCETDPYVVDFWPDGEEHENDIEIPEDIVLYATDFLRLNDGVKCFVGPSRKECNIASEQESDAAIILGVRDSIKDIYSKGRVWLRNYAKSGTIRYFGLPERHYSTIMQQGATGNREFNEDARLWPFTIPEISPKENLSRDEIIVKSGEEYTLFGTKSLHSLKVEAGGKLYLGEGEFVVDDLQLDSKSEITFTKPGYKTILHVNNRISWNGDVQINAYDRILANGFKLYYYGVETFYVYGLWRGSIIAPNAMVVLGQNQRKVLYGQFLAKQLTVHQYSTIRFIPFNPKESEQIALRNNL